MVVVCRRRFVYISMDVIAGGVAQMHLRFYK